MQGSVLRCSYEDIAASYTCSKSIQGGVNVVGWSGIVIPAKMVQNLACQANVFHRFWCIDQGIVVENVICGMISFHETGPRDCK